jgi:hypothetical protein
VTAKTQRWAPEELLRALVEVEITARDASNARLRTKQASFPTRKTIADLTWPPAASRRRLGLPHLAGVDRGKAEPDPDRTGRHRQEPRPDRARPRRRRDRPSSPVLHRRRPRREPLPRPGRQQRRQAHRDRPAQRPHHLRRSRVRTARQHRQPAAVPVRRRRLRTPQPRDRQPLAVRGMGPVPTRTQQHRVQPERAVADGRVDDPLRHDGERCSRTRVPSSPKLATAAFTTTHRRG